MRICIGLLCALLLGGTLSAQVSFSARAPQEVSANEQFTLVFTVNAEAENFQPPSLENFRVIMGPSPSFSRQQINRDVYYTITYSYLLMPKTTGTFTIGTAAIEVDGTTYRSAPINITIRAPRPGDPENPYDLAEKNADLKVLLSKSKVYQGEPIIASYKLYFKSRIGNYRLLDEPDFTGFYKEKVEIPLRRIESERVGAEMINTAILEQRVIIPQQVGKLKAGKVDIVVPTLVNLSRKNRYGNSLRLQETVELDLSAQVPEIEVMPLPLSGQSESFSGAVGAYRMSVDLSREELSANESATLKIKIEGRGNVKLLEMPKPEFPNAFEVYDPKLTENINISEAGMSGSKTVEYLLVPRYGGEYKIPSFSFSYFDPASRTYKEVRSPEYVLKVAGSPRSGSDNNAVSGEKVEVINRDILYIKPRAELDMYRPPFFGSTGFYLSLIILMLLPLIIVVLYFRLKKRKPDQVKMRTGKAGKVARQHLSEAKKQLEAGDRAAFYLALNRALWGYFADRFNISQSRLSKDSIREELHLKGIEESTIAQSMDLMNRAELARFTSSGVSNPQADYAETARLITEIENKL